MTLEGHTDIITGLSLNTNGTKLLSNGMDSQLFSWDIRPFLAEGASRCQQSYVGAKHGAEKVLLKCNWSPVASDSTEQISCGSADR
jgi:Prp8 binding protein